jgi:hypothetical protein
MEAPKATPAISPKKGKYLETVTAVELRTYLKNLGFFEVPDDGTERLRHALAATSASRCPGGPMLIGALVTFLVVILILYLINLLPIDGRAKQICRVVVIILGVISLLKYIAVF